MKKTFKIICVVISAIAVLCCSACGGLQELVGNPKPNNNKITSGDMTNIVIFVNFKDSEEFVNPEYLDKIDKMYNSSPISVKNYYDEISNGKLKVDTDFVTDNGGSVTVSHKLGYYLPKYSWSDAGRKYSIINADGYDNRYFKEGVAVKPQTTGSLKSIDGFYREQTLIREVVSLCDFTGIGQNLDMNKDDKVDSVSFILNTNATSEYNGELIWPHMTTLVNYYEGLTNQFYVEDEDVYDFTLMTTCKIGDKSVYDYDMLSHGYMETYKLTGDYSDLGNIGVICHEFMHTLGLYDYYSYDDANLNFVGELDLMGTTCPIPQYPLTYLREKMGWVSSDKEIMPISQNGTYTLYPVTSDKTVKSYKIVLDNYFETGEYFMIEVRSYEDTVDGFDSMILDKGVIVYRVNEKNAFIKNKNGQLVTSETDYGNMYGNPEVYVIRCGDGKIISNDGLMHYGYFNGDINTGDGIYNKEELGSTDLSLTTSTVNKGFRFTDKTLISYTDGTNSGIALTNIKENEDGSYSFTVSLPTVTETAKTPVLEKHYDGSDKVTWSMGSDGYVYVSAVKKGTAVTDEDIINGKGEFSAKVPTSFRECKLPVFDGAYDVYLATEKDGVITRYNVGTSSFGDQITAEDVNALGEILAGCSGKFDGIICLPIAIIAVLLIKHEKRLEK